MKYDFFLIVIGLMFMIISLLYIFKKKYSEGFDIKPYIYQLNPEEIKTFNYYSGEFTGTNNKTISLNSSARPIDNLSYLSPAPIYIVSDITTQKYGQYNVNPALFSLSPYIYEFIPDNYDVHDEQRTRKPRSGQKYLCTRPVKLNSKTDIINYRNREDSSREDSAGFLSSDNRTTKYNKRFDFATDDSIKINYTYLTDSVGNVTNISSMGNPALCIDTSDSEIIPLINEQTNRLQNLKKMQTPDNIDFKVKTIKITNPTTEVINKISIFNENNFDILTKSDFKVIDTAQNDFISLLKKIDSYTYNGNMPYFSTSNLVYDSLLYALNIESMQMGGNKNNGVLLIFAQPIIITQISILTSGVDSYKRSSNTISYSVPPNLTMDFYDGELSLLTLNTPDTAINTYRHITKNNKKYVYDDKDTPNAGITIISNFTYKQSPTSKNNTLNEIISTIDASYSEVKNTLTNINTINDEIVAKLQILDKNTSCSRTSENNLKIEEAKQLIKTLKTDVDKLKTDIQSQYTALFDAINHIKQKTPIKFTTDDTLNTLNCTDEPELTIIKNESNNKEIKLGFKLPGKDIGIRGKTGKYGEKGSSGTGGLPGENGLPGYWGTK